MKNAVSQDKNLPVNLKNNEDIKNLYYHSPAMCQKVESAYRWSTRYL